MEKLLSSLGERRRFALMMFGLDFSLEVLHVYSGIALAHNIPSYLAVIVGVNKAGDVGIADPKLHRQNW